MASSKILNLSMMWIFLVILVGLTATVITTGRLAGSLSEREIVLLSLINIVMIIGTLFITGTQVGLIKTNY